MGKVIAMVLGIGIVFVFGVILAMGLILANTGDMANAIIIGLILILVYDIGNAMLKPLAKHIEILPDRDIGNSKTRKSKLVLSEAGEQKAFVAWARVMGLSIAHLNNGASSKSRRIYLHAMGCTAGAADILIFDRIENRNDIRGLALEFKSARGRQSPKQVSWQKQIEQCGWVYHVVKSSTEAINVCLSYGLGKHG